jgi:hypothetical protein
MPKMATQCYKTFALKSPINTHYRRATCAEIECEAYVSGWYLLKDNLPEDMFYIATHSGRRYQEIYVDEGGSLLDTVVPQGMYLVFYAGQECFAAASHVISLDRPEFYYIGRGDWRSFNVRNAQQYNKPGVWLDQFATHLDSINTEINRG